MKDEYLVRAQHSIGGICSWIFNILRSVQLPNRKKNIQLCQSSAGDACTPHDKVSQCETKRKNELGMHQHKRMHPTNNREFSVGQWTAVTNYALEDGEETEFVVCGCVDCIDALRGRCWVTFIYQFCWCERAIKIWECQPMNGDRMNHRFVLIATH